MPRIDPETWTQTVGEQKRFLAIELSRAIPKSHLSSLLPKELVSAIAGLLGHSTVEFKIKFIRHKDIETRVFYVFDELFIDSTSKDAHVLRF